MGNVPKTESEPASRSWDEDDSSLTDLRERTENAEIALPPRLVRQAVQNEYEGSLGQMRSTGLCFQIVVSLKRIRRLDGWLEKKDRK